MPLPTTPTSSWTGSFDLPSRLFGRGDQDVELYEDDEAFDGVVSALVLGYVEDWRPSFEEFARVLTPGGFLVFSVGHPIEDFCDDEGAENYFETERLVNDWSVEVPHYRRPLSEMLNPLGDAGFRLEEIAEPQPTEAFREQRPDVYEKESRNPVVLCVRAVLE